MPYKKSLMTTSLVMLTMITAIGIAYAVGNPGFLEESTADIPGGDNTYEVWYTTDCNGGADCECDLDNDVDSDEDSVLDTDSPNDCIATVDSDTDGIFDTGPDADTDGILDVVDLDWAGGGDGSGIVESVPRSVQQTVDRYVDDWGLKNPFWGTEDNRGIFIYDIGYYGLAAGDGSGEELDTEWMLTQAPEPRGTVLHELWHNTQFAYGLGGGSWVIEGQARFLQDKVFDDLDNKVGSRYHNSVNSYLGNTTYVVKEDRDDDGTDEFSQAKGLLGASYNASLWWAYIADQAGTDFAGTAGDGMDAIFEVLKQADDDGRQGVHAVDHVLQDTIGQGFDDTFWDFSVANYAKEYDLTELDHSYLGNRDPETVFKYSDEKRTSPDMLIYDQSEKQVLTIAEVYAGASGRVDGFDSDVDDPDAMSAYGYNTIEFPIGPDCQLAYWRVIGDPGSTFMHSFMLIQSDTNGDSQEEVVSLWQSEGPEFARAAWTFGKTATGGGPRITKVAAIVATGGQPHGYDWEAGCTQVGLDISVPTTDNPAYVGDPADLGRFLVWARVTGSAGTSSFVAGLDWEDDFEVTVGGEDATILNGGYVGNQYWLSVQAPTIAGASIGDKFDLQVSVGPADVAGASDTETDAIIYDLLQTDKVLVIDRSGSMGDNNKLESAKTAARLFADTTQKFDTLGVVSFSDDATQEFPLSLIPDQDDAANVRANAQDAIDDITDDAATSIGDGLAMGQGMLNTGGDPDNQWVMVLLSDGIENKDLFWSTVKPAIVNEKTFVHAIALGHDADEALMSEIAQSTCGAVWQDQCYHFIDESGVNRANSSVNAAGGLPNALADLYRRIQESVAGHQRIWQDQGTLSGSETILLEIKEDGMRDALLSVNWAEKGNPINATLSGGGVTFTKLEDEQNHTVFYADKLPPGTYELQLTATNGASAWIGSLSGRMIKGTEMHAFMGTSRLPGLPVQLQISLTDEKGPVRGAEVTAEVRHPDGDVKTIVLVDDGGIYDDIANDGVYGYSYDRINRPIAVDELLGHSWTFDIQAIGVNNSGNAFTRHKRLSYTPFVREKEGTLDNEGDGMIDRWENRFEGTQAGVADGDKDPDEDGLTNKEEFELGTNPDMPDTDHGGELDGSEVKQGRDPLYTADDKMSPLTNFWIEELPESVILHFDSRPEYKFVRVFRRTGLAGAFVNLGDFDPTGGAVLIKGLVNDEDYFFMIQPVGESDVTGRKTVKLYGEPAKDPFEPEGVVMINNEDKYTSQINVKLQFQGVTAADGSLDVSHVQISNSADLNGQPWQPFSREINWAIDPNPQTDLAMVYVRFRDKAGNVSDTIYGDGILYQPMVAVPWPGSFDFGWLVSVVKSNYFKQFNVLFSPLNGVDLSLLNTSSRAAQAEEEPPVILFGGRAFTIEATELEGKVEVPVTQFEETYSFTLSYEDWQWQSGGIGDEETLNVYIDTGKGWQPLLPCNGCSHDTKTNEFVIVTDLTGDFSLLGEGAKEPEVMQIYLPFIAR
ncbi:MAG: VWA domain-containing protein [Anaerolineae bacterium]